MEKRGRHGWNDKQLVKLRFERFRINRRLLDRSFEIDAKKSGLDCKKRQKKREIALSIFRRKQFFPACIVTYNS